MKKSSTNELGTLRKDVKDLRESMEKWFNGIKNNLIDLDRDHPPWVDESKNPKTHQEYIGEIHTMLCDLLMKHTFHAMRDGYPPDEGFDPRMWDMKKLVREWDDLMKRKRQAAAHAELRLSRIESLLSKLVGVKPGKI